MAHNPKILDAPITITELYSVASEASSGMIKAVVDVEQQLMAIDDEKHADLEIG